MSNGKSNVSKKRIEKRKRERGSSKKMKRIVEKKKKKLKNVKSIMRVFKFGKLIKKGRVEMGEEKDVGVLRGKKSGKRKIIKDEKEEGRIVEGKEKQRKRKNEGWKIKNKIKGIVESIEKKRNM